MPQATLDVDYGYDGALFSDVATQLYSKEADIDYSIQARPQFADTDVVKLGFAVPTAGQYTLSLERVSGVFCARPKHLHKRQPAGHHYAVG